MARPQPPVDTVRVAVKGTIFTQPYVNVFWWQVTRSGTPAIADLNAAVDAFAGFYNTDIAPVMPPEAAFGEFDAVWQTGVGTALVSTRTVSHVGTAGAAVKDAEACQLINWHISAHYRGGKPRTYLPGAIDAHVTDGHLIDASWRSSVAGRAADFLGHVNAITNGTIATVKLGTVSFFTAGGSETIPPTYRTPPVFEPYLSASVRQIIASQRRRLGR